MHPPLPLPPPLRAPITGWVVVGTGTLVVFASLGLARFGYGALLPAMQASLGLDNTGAGALAAANLAGYLVAAVLGGALASRWGGQRVVTLGLLLAAAGMLLTGLCRGATDAALWRTVTGLGSGAANVPVMGLLASWAATRRRGLVTGIGVSGSSLALIVVGPLTPRLLAAAGPDGWRTGWQLFASLTLLVAVAAWLILRDRPSDVGLLPIGLRPGEAAPPALRRGAGLEWGRVYRSARVWHLGGVYTAFGFSYIIYMTFFIKRLVAGGAWTPAAAGRLFTLMGLCSLACGVLWGLLSDRLGRRAALVMLYVVHAVAYALFAVDGSTAAWVISAVLFGLSAWSIPSIMAAASGDLLGPSLAPTALGFVTLFFGVGQALGPYVAGAVADATHTFTPVFLLAALVSLLGALSSLWLSDWRTGKSPSPAPRSARCP